MIETIFKFELQMATGETEAVMQHLNNQLLELKGVESTNPKQESCYTELSIKISVKDSEEAKSLHRRIVNTLIKCDGVAISQVRTKLTDIF